MGGGKSDERHIPAARVGELEGAAVRAVVGVAVDAVVFALLLHPAESRTNPIRMR
jgi:hypothetical protein